MQNKQAIQIIEKIQKEIHLNKFQIDTAVADLKKVRELTMEEQNPVLTKALRLAYEHLDQNEAFLIEIPNDDLFEGDLESDFEPYSKENNLESFNYFLSLLLNFTKKNNLLDLKEYNKALIAF